MRRHLARLLRRLASAVEPDESRTVYARMLGNVSQEIDRVCPPVAWGRFAEYAVDDNIALRNLDVDDLLWKLKRQMGDDA